MVQRMALVVLCLLAACVDSRSVVCGPLVCSEASVCAPSGDRCVQPQQLDICAGQADGTGCSFPGVSAGSCSKEICEPIGCGNGVVEVDLAEVCDDGNRISGDGCNGLCTSRETCGDGVAEASQGEQCDCGDGTMTVVGCTGPNSNDPGATCRPDSCHLARCGDGIIDPFEVCDDGNTTPGDGCRADCQGRWTRMVSNTFADLDAVWGLSATNVLATSTEGLVLHFDGTAWKDVTPTTAYAYEGVWGAGTEMYVIANSNDTASPRIYRWDGSALVVAVAYTDNSLRLTGIYGRSATDYWVVGTQGGGPFIEHRDGTPTVESCPGLAGPVTGVWADSSSAKVVVAASNGDVCVFDSAWQRTSPGIFDVWGTSATDLYGISSTGPDLLLRSTSGTGWTGIAATNVLKGIYGIGGIPGDINVMYEFGRVMRFDGTSWAISPVPVATGLTDLWAYDVGKGFMVGHKGVILF